MSLQQDTPHTWGQRFATVWAYHACFMQQHTAFNDSAIQAMLACCLTEPPIIWLYATLFLLKSVTGCLSNIFSNDFSKAFL